MATLNTFPKQKLIKLDKTERLVYLPKATEKDKITSEYKYFINRYISTKDVIYWQHAQNYFNLMRG
jgi:hypothetical protein